MRPCLDCAGPLSAVSRALAPSSLCGKGSGGYHDLPTGMRKTAGERTPVGLHRPDARKRRAGTLLPTRNIAGAVGSCGFRIDDLYLPTDTEAVPTFMPARNNLATCYYQTGKVDLAIQTARQTCELAPDNCFAEAALAKFEFLTGHEDRANAIADRFVQHPAKQQDPLVAQIEALSYLGRHEDVIVVSAAVDQLSELDSHCRDSRVSSPGRGPLSNRRSKASTVHVEAVSQADANASGGRR